MVNLKELEMLPLSYYSRQSLLSFKKCIDYYYSHQIKSKQTKNEKILLNQTEIVFFIDFSLFSCVFFNNMSIFSKYHSKQLSTGIGSYLLHVAAGITTIWGSTNVYYLSYFHEQDPTIDASTNSIILISVVIPLSIILVLSNKICEQLGTIKTIQLCSIIFFISQFAIYINFSLITFVIFTLIVPVSCITVAIIPTLNLIWSHFSSIKSICTAVNLVFLGLGTILWNISFIALVNPNNEEAVIDSSQNPLFSSNVSRKIERATKIIIFICSLIFIGGAYLMKDFKTEQPQNKVEQQGKVEIEGKSKKQEERREKNRLTCQRTILVNKGSQEIIQQTKQVQLQQDNEQKQQVSEPIQFITALKDQRCWLIFLLLIVIDIYPVYLLNNFKVIFMPIFNDDYFLAACITVNTIANILGTFVWGFLAHKLGNIKTVSLVGVCTLIGGILGFFSKNKVAIIIFIIFFGVGDRGMETIAGPALVQIFGLKTATLLLPYKGLSLIIGFILAPVFQIITSKYFNSFQQLDFLFNFCVISFVICVYYTLKFRQIDEVQEKQEQKPKQTEKEQQLYQNFQNDIQVQSKITQE